MTRDEFEVLREGWEFEAKLARGRDGQGELPESFWPTYSAMANTEGGTIVLGAKERADGSFDFRGIPDLDKVERDLWNCLQNPQKVSGNVLGRQDVTRESVDGQVLLVVRVPKAPRSLRPVFLNGSWERGTYLRVHDGDRVADREVARRMMADALPERDSMVLEGFGEADLDPDSVRAYRNVFAAKRPDHPFVSEDDAAFLLQAGVIASDRVRGILGLTLGGLLMLGRERALLDRFPHWHLSYRELPADPASGERWVDRIANDGTWNANAFQFYNRVIGKLYQGLKVPFALDAQQFRRDETPAHKAVREALVNTIIHADYEGRSGLRVLRDLSGYEFINPGLLLVLPQQVWKGGISECRNPVLQRLFGLIQLAEHEGSGGPTIRQAWAHQHYQPPALAEDVEHSESHLRLRQLSLLPAASIVALRQRLGGQFDGQDELGRLALATAHAEGGITHARLATLTDAHTRDVTLKLQELLRRKLLGSSGPSRSKTYTLLPPAQVRLPGIEASSGQSSEGSSPGPVETSEESAVLAIGQTIGQTIGQSLGQSSGQSSAASGEARGWAPIGHQGDAILAYCLGEWRTVAQIAAAIRRAEPTVRKHYLPPLVASGELERLYPDSPRHPFQAYRTAKKEP
jgi:predicted HTH transcriptional regulator